MWACEGRGKIGYWVIYLSSHINVLKNLFSPFPLFSLFFLLYPVSHESHTVYLRTTMMWSGGLCCTAQYEKCFIGTIPIWIFHSYTGVHNPYLHVLGTHGRNYDMYLGLGMRYEVEICTIVISMNRAFNWCPFCCRLNFDPKSWKTMDYSLCLSAILAKMLPASKITFRTSFESSFDADHNGTNPSFIPHSHTKIRVFPWTMIRCLQYCDQQNGAFKWCPFCYSSAPKDIPVHWRHLPISRHSCKVFQEWNGASVFIWSSHKDSNLLWGWKRYNPSLIHAPGLLTKH